MRIECKNSSGTVKVLFEGNIKCNILTVIISLFICHNTEKVLKDSLTENWNKDE